MSISTNAIIIGLILGVLFGGAIIVWRQRYRDLFGAFLVVGILALAVVVTIYQVDQFRAQKAEANQLAQSQPSQPIPMRPRAKPARTRIRRCPPAERMAMMIAIPH